MFSTAGPTSCGGQKTHQTFPHSSRKAIGSSLSESTRSPGPLSSLQVGLTQSLNSCADTAILLTQTLSQPEMWREAPGAPCGVAMGRSCLCTGGTATETCRLAATTTLVRASTCSSLTTPTPCYATRLSTSTSTTLAEGRGDGHAGVCWLEWAASWCLLLLIGKSSRLSVRPLTWYA